MSTEKFNFDKDNQPLKDTQMSQGVKLKSNRSKFARQAKQKDHFEERVQNVQKVHEGHLQEGYELGQAFLKRIKDKTLPDNKGPIEKSIESETIGNLVNWIIKVNNDTNEQKMGMGSAGVMALVLNSILKIRDNYNIILHKNEVLMQEISVLKNNNDEIMTRLDAIEKLSREKASV